MPGAWALTELRHVHRVALTPAWDVAPHSEATAAERPGSFREHDVRPFGSGMQPPPWPGGAGVDADWLADVQALAGEGRDVEPEAPARLHAGFEQVHRFLDGNGRAGRLVLNLLFVRLGCPPVIIFKGDRAAVWLGYDAPTRETPARSESSLLARSWTTCTSSSCLPSPGRCGSFRSPRSPRSHSQPTRSGWPPPGAASKHRSPPTAPGAAPEPGSTSTSPVATGAKRRQIDQRPGSPGQRRGAWLVHGPPSTGSLGRLT